MRPGQPHARQIWQLLADVVLINLSGWTALTLRFTPVPIPADCAQFYWAAAGPLTLLRLVCFWRLQIYKIHCQYVGIRDLLAVAQGVTQSSAIFFVPLVVSGRLHYPYAVAVTEWLLAILALGSSRVLLRVTSTLRSEWRAKRGAMQRLLIVGAGGRAEALAREVGRHPDLGLRLVGFVDDDPQKHGMFIHGAPVLGPVDQVAEVVARHAVEHVVIAIPSATGPQIRRLIALCENLMVHLLIAPSFKTLIGQQRGEALAMQVVSSRFPGLSRAAPSPSGLPEHRRTLPFC